MSFPFKSLFLASLIVAVHGQVVVNEVADKGAFSTCGGTATSGGADYVELLNTGTSAVDLAGFTLHDDKGPLDPDAFKIPALTLAAGGTIILCSGYVGSFQFGIGGTDAVTLLDASGALVSTSGALPGGGSSTSTYQRNADGTYSYATPTPSTNVYVGVSTSPAPTVAPIPLQTFVPVTIPWQSCGKQTLAYGLASTYTLQNRFTIGINPEFSGGTFDGRTCKHLVIGDEGTVTEFSFDGTPLVPTRGRVIDLIGGSRDTEGNCMYHDASTGVTKYVFVDERERKVAMCDFPSESNSTKIYRDSSNCNVFSLTAAQILLTSSDANQGLEDVACHPEAGKLYVIQEKNPMRVWEVDVVTKIFKELIDVQSKTEWTSLITDIAGLSFDPISNMLYVLSEESKLVVQSTLNGTIISTLNVSMANQPEGIHFTPSTGELWITSEPNQIFRFTFPAVPTPRPSPAPIPSPTAPLTPSPTFPPTPSPTNQPTVLPSSPSIDSTCEDLKNVAFYIPRIGMNRTCAWLAASSRDMMTLCMKNSSAYYICEETCGACSDLCTDDPAFTFDFKGENYDCKWLSVRPRNQASACKSSAVSDACAETCDSCPEPTSSLSAAPVRSPLEVSTPAPTIAVTTAPTPSPTVAPPCYDDDYTKFNVIMGGSTVSQGCVWLRARVAEYGPTLCSPVGGAAYSVCPVTCEKCTAKCSDSVDYVFEDFRGGIRDCVWLSKTTRDRNAYCSNGADAFCKQTCETC